MSAPAESAEPLGASTRDGDGAVPLCSQQPGQESHQHFLKKHWLEYELFIGVEVLNVAVTFDL